MTNNDADIVMLAMPINCVPCHGQPPPSFCLAVAKFPVPQIILPDAWPSCASKASSPIIHPTHQALVSSMVRVQAAHPVQEPALVKDICTVPHLDRGAIGCPAPPHIQALVGARNAQRAIRQQLPVLVLTPCRGSWGSTGTCISIA